MNTWIHTYTVVVLFTGYWAGLAITADTPAGVACGVTLATINAVAAGYIYKRLWRV